MNETVSLSLAWAAGILLGTLFFGGHQWTIRTWPSLKWRKLFQFTSLSVRTALALAGLYWVSRGPWEGIGVFLVGFMIGRLIVTRLTRRGEKPVSPVVG